MSEEKKGWFSRFRSKKPDTEAQAAPDAVKEAPKTEVAAPAAPEPVTTVPAATPDTPSTNVPCVPEPAEETAPETKTDPAPAPETDVSEEALAEPEPQATPDPQAEPEPQSAPEPEPAPKLSWFQRLKAGLKKSTSAISDGITGIFTQAKLDDDTLEELEDLLITSDLGVSVASKLTSALSEGRFDKEISGEEVKTILADEIEKILAPVAKPLVPNTANKPHVILMAGVNGAGKTTTIGKLAKKYRDEGKKVMLAAGDTFRAAAVEQLQVWGERTGVPVVTKEIGADAAALAFEALERATNEGMDVLLIDTAGRLQNRDELMAELAKVVRVIGKKLDGAPHDTVIVLDATTGQNAVHQVEVFQKMAAISGIVMTKLDGSARGGVLVACADKFGLPVHAIGVGESIEDLQPFDAREFARTIVGLE